MSKDNTFTKIFKPKNIRSTTTNSHILDTTALDTNQDISCTPDATVVEIKGKINKTLNLVDLSKTIDICAEGQAFQEFEEKMRNYKDKNLLGKIPGFFMRSMYRMGREAWIYSRKKEIIRETNKNLEKGIYDHSDLEQKAKNYKKILDNNLTIDIEQTIHGDIPENIQKLINDWVITDNDTQRDLIISNIKKEIESHIYSTLDLNQIRSSLEHLEADMFDIDVAALKNDAKTISLKLNLYDIGRIEDGYSDKEKSFTIKSLEYINKSNTPKWIKSFILNPNIAAIATAILTRRGISSVARAGGVGITGGLLAPIAIGATVGGTLAAKRAKREREDRNAIQDRNNALGFDQKSNIDSISTKDHQTSLKMLYDEINSQNIKTSLNSSLNFLISLKIGRDRSINTLRYDLGTNLPKGEILPTPAEQNLKMRLLISQKFPNLLKEFNNWASNSTTKNPEISEILQKLEGELNQKIITELKNRDVARKNYGLKQGLIYGGGAFVIGSSIGALLEHLGFGISNTNKTSEIIEETQNIIGYKYPDNLNSIDIYSRGWYDNMTIDPDKTELLLFQNGNNWDVSNLIGKSPYNASGSYGAISPSDFTSGKIQALVTLGNSEKFLINIDSEGNLQIPNSLKDIFNSRGFKMLEIGEINNHQNNISINDIVAIRGSGDISLDKIAITETIHTSKTINSEISTTSWHGVPMFATKYDELEKPTRTYYKDLDEDYKDKYDTNKGGNLDENLEKLKTDSGEIYYDYPLNNGEVGQIKIDYGVYGSDIKYSVWLIYPNGLKAKINPKSGYNKQILQLISDKVSKNTNHTPIGDIKVESLVKEKKAKTNKVNIAMNKQGINRGGHKGIFNIKDLTNLLNPKENKNIGNDTRETKLQELLEYLGSKNGINEILSKIGALVDLDKKIVDLKNINSPRVKIADEVHSITLGTLSKNIAILLGINHYKHTSIDGITKIWEQLFKLTNLEIKK